ncbi:hypothetical protein BZA05DRAFT_128983 [Tricharina praecox]|uniref:uncharacterized protein n=1 Tax=Tricharina praecox TaxID=43433 RepID=UPI002220C157|nr:uncharacterized protein BZA05DRAFT_128983 [Tricharina praecox]KAI5846865.1 hypothetical protein BZA05DRAFT_128983 [Tricharina praecox]
MAPQPQVIAPTATTTATTTATATVYLPAITSYVRAVTSNEPLPVSATVGVSVVGGMLLILALAGIVICIKQKAKRRRHKGKRRATENANDGPENMTLKLKPVADD